MPFPLRELKVNQGRRFSKSLKRQAAFLHLAQVTRPVLNKNTLQSLSQELSELLMDEIGLERIRDTKVCSETLLPRAEIKILDALENLLEKDFFIDALIELLDGLVREVVENNTDDVTDKARYSIFHWIYTLGKISYWMTENKSDNFITFHLMSSLLQEYLLLAFENQRDQDHETAIHSKLKKHLKGSEASSQTCFESPTSCFLVTHEKQKYSLRRQKRNVSKCIVPDSQVGTELDFKKQKQTPFFEQINGWTVCSTFPQIKQADSGRNEMAQSNFFHKPQVYKRASLGNNCAYESCDYDIRNCTSLPMTGKSPFESASNEEVSFQESQIFREFPLHLETYCCTNYSNQQSGDQSHLDYEQHRGSVWDSGGYVTL